MKRLTSSTTTVFLLSMLYAGCGGAGNEAVIDGADPAGTTGTTTTAGSAASTAGATAGGTTTAGSAASGSTGSSGSATSGTTTGSTTAGSMTGSASTGSSSATSATNGSMTGSTGSITPPPPPDADGDGVVDERDLCPGTSSAVRVNANGCDLATDAAASIKWGQPIPKSATPAPLPQTGAVEANGFMSFVVDAAGKFPMIFRSLAANVQSLANGFHVKGAILLDVPGGTVTLAEADVAFEYGSSSADGIKTLHGSARGPFPDLGMGDRIEIESPVAEFGLDTGKNLASLKAPLVDDRRYLYFHFSDKLSAKPPSTLRSPAGSTPAPGTST
jgi:hypothetical protein